ncbi:MAG: MFS transporter [Chloroflexota bacterium]|nr:MFS transporter [Chloroflexota bacterium]
MAKLRPIRPPSDEDSPASSGSFFRWLWPGSAMSATMPALRSRDFRLFWFGQLVSLSGTWIQSVAQQWLVLKLTGSAFDLGLVTTVQFTPLLLISLISGAVADRVSKRNLLLVTQVISGLLAVLLGMLVATGTVQYWHVLVIAGMLGTVNAFYTPARQAFVPELVEKDALMNAIALNSAIFNAARVVGPAIGGILIASLGLSLNFFLNAASYLAVIASLLLIRPRPVEASRKEERLLQNVAEGLQYIMATPVVLTILSLVGVASLFALNFTTLMPVFARFVLHVGSDGYGFLMASMGVGSLAGAISLAFFNRRSLTRIFIYAGAIALTIFETIFALSRIYPLSVGLLVIVGLSSTLFTTTANTRILSLTPSHLQGRVMSVYSLMFLGMTPFGSFLAGLVAQHFGAPTALIAGAIITFIFTLAMFMYRRGHRTPEPATATS